MSELAPRRKVCIQEKYPEIQTPCFQAVESSCAERSCTVLGIIKVLAQMEQRKVSKGEIAALLHEFCNNSNMGPDPDSFNRKLLERIENGEL